eukprot:TRINITY_DN18901_c0_g1_i1.p1 TRINITY_DN18901_c0_g1~~TRINITY_DN18901_c0_g1_i1.p1  ORF type:complete len:338 (-),score=18.28 TRINITY_DN18901_c0_g1_i1:555-1568(-)
MSHAAIGAVYGSSPKCSRPFLTAPSSCGYSHPLPTCLANASWDMFQLTTISLCACTNSLPQTTDRLNVGGRRILQTGRLGTLIASSGHLRVSSSLTSLTEQLRCAEARAANRGLTRVRAIIIDAEEAQVRPFDDDSVGLLKNSLLATVAGLDRGLSAGDDEAVRVEDAAVALERAGNIVELPEMLPVAEGKWRLVYSSGFLTGSLGGERPGPPVGRLPLKLGQVYQRIDVGARQVDNIVTLNLEPPWPLPVVTITATLAHTFENFGQAGTRIIFEKTSVKLEAPLGIFPEVEFPQLPEALRPPSGVRSGEFETTYLDDDIRVTRGDRGELRVFVRAG